MSIVQATSKGKIEARMVEPLVIKNTEMDDRVVSDLVEGHLKDFRDLQSTDASLLFGKPIVLKNCTISAEHLEVLQTLPKLRMLRLEDCTISGGTKVTGKFAHIGAQKDSAPIMSEVAEHQELPKENRDKQDAVDAPVLAVEVPKTGTRWVSIKGLQNYIWQYLKTKVARDNDPLKTEAVKDIEVVEFARIIFLAVVNHFLGERRALPGHTPFELTDVDLQTIREKMDKKLADMRSVGVRYARPQTNATKIIKIEGTLRESDAATLLELRTCRDILCTPASIAIRQGQIVSGFAEQMWDGFE